MSIKVMNGFIAVELINTKVSGEKTTEGGIIVPVTVEEEETDVVLGKVLSVCKSDDGDINDVKEEDKVFFNRHQGNQAFLENKKVVLIRKEEIMGILG